MDIRERFSVDETVGLTRCRQAALYSCEGGEKAFYKSSLGLQT